MTQSHFNAGRCVTAEIGIESAKPRIDTCSTTQTIVGIKDSIHLHATASDSFGGLIEKDEWKCGSGSWRMVGDGDTTVIAPATARSWVCSLRVTDDDGNVAYDHVSVTVETRAPVAKAGPDANVRANDTVHLCGSGSSDETAIVEYAWKCGDGTWVVDDDGDTTVTAPAASQWWVCSLRVTDDDGTAKYDQVTFLVQERQGPVLLILAKDSCFEMGSAPKRVPVHTVCFSEDFSMDTTEVTQGDYSALMSSTYPGYTDPDWSNFGTGADYPAYYVNWYDAALYCNARTKRDGYDTVYSYNAISGTPGNECELIGLGLDLSKNGYRLPTEAEWEFACRAGTSTDYYWGTGGIGQNAWHSDNSAGQSHPVATKLPNTYGLYDMSGNLWEWCNDWYEDPYSTSPETDPPGPSTGERRVARGGSWFALPDRGRSAYRSSKKPESRGNDDGFRCVLPR